MSRPLAIPIQVPKSRGKLQDPANLRNLGSLSLATSPGALSATSSSLASTSDPLPILKAESLRVFNQARALYIRITVVHQASAARASFAVPKSLLVALDEYQARSEDLRSAAHRLIVSVEADERRQLREREEPDAVVMLGSHGKQMSSDAVIPLDILIAELQHLDGTLERLEWEWNRSDVSAYWYGPCVIPGFVHSDSESHSDFTSNGADNLFTFASTGLGSDSIQGISASDPLSSPPSAKLRALRLSLSPRSPNEARAGITAMKMDKRVSPLTPIDMPAPFRPPTRHRSGTSSLLHLHKHAPTPSKLGPSAPQQHRHPSRSSVKTGSYLPALAFREWEDDELDVGRTRDIVLGCML